MAEKIQDFGERLEGAAKFYAAEYRERLGEQHAGAGAEAPLGRAWPAPNYEKLLRDGADPWTVGLLRGLRDSAGTRPTGRYAHYSGEADRWDENMRMLRGLALHWFGMTREQVIEDAGGEQELPRELTAAAEAYRRLGHGLSLAKHFINYSEKAGCWRVYRRAKSMHRPRIEAPTLEALIEKLGESLKRGAVQRSAPKPIKFALYRFQREPLTWHIMTKVGPKGTAFLKTGYLSLHTVKDTGEGYRYIKENREALEERVRQWKRIPAHRRDSNRPRAGPEHRNGPATPEMFMQAFEPKGVQFGNYVNAAERQDSLNQAYDALMDLSEILDVPPKALFFNRSLGLAFGARGRGGKNAPSAHYEPGYRTINLTKPRGAGSLAHEWFHAFDYWAAKQPGEPGPGGHQESGRRATLSEAAGEAPRWAPALSQLGNVIRGGRLKQRSAQLDARRSKPYWAKPLEVTARAFESFVKDRLAERGQHNDYLVNIVSLDDWKAAWGGREAAGDSGAPESPYLDQRAESTDYPYPAGIERKTAAEAFPAVIGHYMRALREEAEPEAEAALPLAAG